MSKIDWRHAPIRVLLFLTALFCGTMAAAQTGGPAVLEGRYAGIEAAGVGGGRIAKGEIHLPGAREVRVSLPEKPTRLEWIRWEGEIGIAAHLANGGAVFIQVPSGHVSPLPAGFSGNPSGEYWPPYSTSGGMLTVTRDGSLVWSEPGRQDMELGAELLPDTRVAAIDEGNGSIRRFAVFASPTPR
ncbi:MAG: hypothetical protein RQ801_15685, partial [Spirochaetaceae bacterium]|nr:hypothetical protein [Spirochaetaceae bacterium]